MKINYGYYASSSQRASYKNGNGRDWWVITKVFSNLSATNLWHVYSVTPNGITDSIQGSGFSESRNLENLVFYNNGSKLLFSSFQGLVETMEFDRCSGIISNPQTITSSSARYIGSAISSNGQVLYLSTNNPTSYLYQFDLTATNIFNSRIVIDTISYPASAGGVLRLAPNNKIYWGIPFTDGHYPYHDNEYNVYNMNLSVINNPDVLDTGCNFTRFSTFLGGKRSYYGLPNNPLYEAPSLSGSVCDTITSGVIETESDNPSLDLYYYSGWNKLFINGKYLSGNMLRCSLFDVLGQSVGNFEFELNGSFLSEEIDVGFLSTGIYIISLSDLNQTVSKKNFKY